MRSALWQTLSLIGLLLWTTPSFAVTCKLSGDNKDIKEIAKSCESLVDTMDATELKMKAFDQCCGEAGAFLKKNPMPCAEKTRVQYRIRLGLSVCDSIKDPSLDYEQKFCVDQMLYHISDPKVIEIADKCSPTGGRSKKDKKGQRPGDAKPDEVKTANAKAVKDPDEDKPIDLHMDDEDFSKCQRAKLAKYLEKLDIEIKRAPADQSSCKN